jgi:hypothetical protein
MNIFNKANECFCGISRESSLNDPQNTYGCSYCEKSWFRGEEGEGFEYSVCKHCDKPFTSLWNAFAPHLEEKHNEIYLSYKKKTIKYFPTKNNVKKMIREHSEKKLVSLKEFKEKFKEIEKQWN